MEHINHITQLIGIKDKNIILNKVLKHENHIEVIATLDYCPPKCKHCMGKQIKYDFQKPSKIPFIEIGGFPSLIRLKKRRFQCKFCQKVTVSETNLVKKNCQISEILRQKISQLLLNREALTHIASNLAIATSTVYRKFKQFHSKRITPLCLKFSLGMNSHEIRANWPSLHKILRRERLSLSLRTTSNQPSKTTSTSTLEWFENGLKS